MAEKLNLGAPWEEVKERMKENDVNLTDEDLQFEPGGEDELLNRLQAKMNKDREEIRQYIESIAANKPKAG
jgi:uncharacterized protein YjbJ (UPF0337 family)